MYVINRPPRVRHFVACLSRSISQSLKTETVNVPICETKGVWSSSTFCQGKKKVIASIHWNCWSLQFLNWYLDPIWILCNITKAGPMCFSFGRKFDSELILFAVSKKVPFSDLVNTKQESGLVTFYQHAQKVHHLEQGERERAWHLSCVFSSTVPQALDGFAGSYILGRGLVFGWGTLG